MPSFIIATLNYLPLIQMRMSKQKTSKNYFFTVRSLRVCIQSIRYPLFLLVNIFILIFIRWLYTSNFVLGMAFCNCWFWFLCFLCIYVVICLHYVFSICSLYSNEFFFFYRERRLQKPSPSTNMVWIHDISWNCTQVYCYGIITWSFYLGFKMYDFP